MKNLWITTADDNQIIVWNNQEKKKYISEIINAKKGEHIKYGASTLSKLPDNQWSRAVWFNQK